MSELSNIRLLPTALIITNFVQGNPNSNYEKYLLEFVNSSSYFLKKSNGHKYVHPEKEDGAKCDCISDNYKIDFKMLIAPTMAQAKNIFTPSICQPYPYITMRGAAKVKPSDKCYSPIDATILHTWFRELTVDELYKISKSEDFPIPAYKDIKSILGAINKPKNILCMLPYEYICNDEDDVITKEKEIIKTISIDYRTLADYRMKARPKHENYIAFVFMNNLLILQFKESAVTIADRIPLSKSEIFCRLKNI